ncbi:endo-alpha-N-acetylgalactosaminidase family protein [uncultured Microbacterium sp.]|uniref:endo-alpha-N-acetylgalactosaminidase family protein n=1 Tax=uncultured Microbacterium sp. TaxID=191216 RepID=UPI00261B6949|nr:endo-alpha-N-acetylgalactosaminidase family protein [uncultured Microbacterium sp.]
MTHERTRRSARPPKLLASALVGTLMCGGIITGGILPASAADLIDVPKTDYELLGVSSESDAWPAPPALDGTALAAFDGDFTTQWTSRYADEAPFPHWLALDLQQSLSIAGVDYSVKKGQKVAASEVAVYVTDDAEAAAGSPSDGGWGDPVATATLNAPTADDEQQRIEFDEAVTGRYVAFEIRTAQGTTGGGIGELSVLSDEAVPALPEPEPDPEPEEPGEPIGDVFEISNGGTTAILAQGFPTINGYRVGDAELGGQTGYSKWVVDGTERTATTTAEVEEDIVRYVSVLDGVDATIRSEIRVDDAGVVRFEVTEVDGTVNTLGLSGNAFLTASVGDGEVVLDRTVVSPDSRTSADEHLPVTAETVKASANAAYAFLGDGDLVGGVVTNATTQASNGTASWNTRLTTSVSGTGAAIGSSAWLINPTSAVDERAVEYELPRVTVVLATDRNDDGSVDWQDAAIAQREATGTRYGGERVADRVVNRIPFNFASSATNPFDLVLDNTQRIANQTDGLGQWVLNKGFGSEGHDSANTDYGGNHNERAGGLDALNGLVEQGKALNADMSVHVNATEAYPQANSFDPATLTGSAPFNPGWNWLDQSFYIDQQKDLGQGLVLDRFQQLADEVPGLSGVYIDVYYSNGWVAEELADELNAMGLEVATEWGDRFVDNAVWAHWPTDLNYGGVENKGINSTMVRFMQNGEADIWNADALLGHQDLVDAEGWAGNSNWDGFIGNVWEVSLPTKFVQHFDLLSYEQDVVATLTDGVEITIDDGVRTITMGGATVLRGDSYLLPWQSLESSDETGSPVDADKMYFYSASGGEHAFDLTAAFAGAEEFVVYELTDQGRERVGTVRASDAALTLTGEAGTAYVVEPTAASARAAVEYRSGGIDDPGFNAGTLDAWNPRGDVSLARTDEGGRKADPTGDNIVVLGSGEASISQQLTGLTPGQAYTFSAQVEIEATEQRNVTIAADTGTGTAERRWSLSPTVNYMRADSKAALRYQRGSVAFVAPESGEVTVSIAAADGDAAVSIDNARVMVDTTSPTASGAVYSNDFEGNQPGWGPFVKGDAGGIEDPRTSISQRNDPYTSKEWRNTAAPHASGAVAGLAVDSVLSGEHSLMSNSENNGIVYRTDPTLVALQPGHTYEIAFDYQVGATGSYRWLQGIDTLADGDVRSTTLQATRLEQALETTKFSHELTVGCGDASWVGLERIGGAAVSFVLDDFTVTDLGETPGGTACATVSARDAALAPGVSTVFETTFTNAEDIAVENIGVALDVPEGYEVLVADDSSNLFDEVASGESVTTTWLVTAPADAAGTSARIGISATYLADCDVRTTAVTVNADVASRARIPNGQISVTASSEETAAGAKEGPAELLLDGDASTIWHTQYNGASPDYPHELVFDLGSIEQVEGIGYLRRPANRNGPIKGYTVEASTDGSEYAVVAEGEWADSADWQDVVFDAVDARFLRVTAVSPITDGTPFAAAAEMAVYGTPSTAPAGHAPAVRPDDELGDCDTAVDPLLILGSSSVPAGGRVSTELSGFAPDSAVSFWLDDRRLAGSAVDRDGALRTDVLIPADAAAGDYTLSVRDAAGETAASAALEVTAAVDPAGPEVILGVDSMRAGGSIDVQLRGFDAGGAVQLWLHSDPVLLGQVVVGADGTALATVTIPVSTTAGQHALVVTDATGAEIARADLIVSAAVDAPDGGLAITGLDGARLAVVLLAAIAAAVVGMRLRVRSRRGV